MLRLLRCFQRRLAFLVDLSDRLEQVTSPTPPYLPHFQCLTFHTVVANVQQEAVTAPAVLALEVNAGAVVGRGGWSRLLDPGLQQDMNKYRK